MSRRSAFPPDLVQITTGRTTARKAAATRAEKAMAKRAAKDIKKGNKTDPFSNTEKMKKESRAKTTARMAAAERAKLVPPSERTPAQTRAIKSESRVRLEREWRQLTADTKRSQSELRKMVRDVKRSAKAIKAAATAPKVRGESKKGGRKSPGGPRRLFVGRGGGRGGGSMGGSGGGLPDYNR
jgi:hypothetical protein